MVLNKSKWDHKAKVQYLRKHNLTRPKPKNEVRPKWSGKKTQRPAHAAWLDEADNDEWASDDDALLNHFYPHLSDHDVPLEHKKKFRKHIIELLRSREESDPEQPEPERHDGIYLGNPREASFHGNSSNNDSNFNSNFNSSSTSFNVESSSSFPDYDYDDYDASDEDDEAMMIPDLEAKLSDFALSDFGKNRNRKILKSQMSDNLLEEYGIDSYRDTVKDTDYTEGAQRFRNIDKLKADDLHGMRIGQQPTNSIRELNQEEQREHEERKRKLEHANFHDRIRAKFGTEQGRNKVLEINNFNAADEAQMSYLNSKLERAPDQDSDVDLDELLGITAPPEETGPADVMDLLPEKAPQRKSEAPKRAQPQSNDFLDDLLGM